MSQQLIARNEDLKKLRDEGYDIAIVDGYVVVKAIPYLNANKEIRLGSLLCPLEPRDHTVLFCGEYPHKQSGGPIEAIRCETRDVVVNDTLCAQHKFSNKPKDGYRNSHQIITRYVEIIENEAKAVDPAVTAKTFPAIEDTDEGSVFKYVDTASSRANITGITARLKSLKIAIVGLGGTGSYVLDFVAKTEVREIHLFDGDVFSQHNAFRSPGAPTFEELNAKPSPTKVDYFAAKYGNMRTGIVVHREMLHGGNCESLAGMDFVFLCIDSGDAKKAVVDFMVEKKIPFIDAGIGLRVRENSLYGQMRVTSTSQMRAEPAPGRISFGEPDPNAVYATNIQVAEMNALAASLAVIKWKKLFGFYVDTKMEHNTTYMLEENVFINDDVGEDSGN